MGEGSERMKTKEKVPDVENSEGGVGCIPGDLLTCHMGCAAPRLSVIPVLTFGVQDSPLYYNYILSSTLYFCVIVVLYMQNPTCCL